MLPVLTLLVGVSLLGRELWLRWRRGSGAMAPLTGPNLSALDVVLLVAGGFVVVGELLTPLLVAPLLEAALGNLALAPALRHCRCWPLALNPNSHGPAWPKAKPCGAKSTRNSMPWSKKPSKQKMLRAPKWPKKS